MSLNTRIKIIGFGVEGTHLINQLIEMNIQDVDFITIHRDDQSFVDSQAILKIDIEKKAKTEVDEPENFNIEKQGVFEYPPIEKIVQNSNIVFLLTGEGTGLETAISTAKMARKMGILTLGYLIQNKGIADSSTSVQNEMYVQNFYDATDSLIELPKDDTVNMTNVSVGEEKVYIASHELLSYGIKSISELMTQSSMLSVQLADVKHILQDAGPSLLGMRRTTGKTILQTASVLTSAPIVGEKIAKAEGLFIAFRGSEHLTLYEMHQAVEIISEAADKNAHMIWGHIWDESLGEVVELIVIAAGAVKT